MGERGGGVGGGTAAVQEWLAGLPGDDELTPLSQSLIPPRLAAAFSIKAEPPRTASEVHRASEECVASLRRQISSSSSSSAAAKDSSPPAEEEPDEGGGRTPKRPRLVWTPQLHKRFVDVVGHLGIKNAVPKTIMQLMNVEGLTRENVASHLQKYRLYLKRMQGVSVDDHHLFDALPAPSRHEQRPPPPVQQMPYAPTRPPPGLIPMPMIGMGHPGHGPPIAMVPISGGQIRAHHHPHHHHNQHPYSWPSGPR